MVRVVLCGVYIYVLLSAISTVTKNDSPFGYSLHVSSTLLFQPSGTLLRLSLEGISPIVFRCVQCHQVRCWCSNHLCNSGPQCVENYVRWMLLD